MASAQGRKNSNSDIKKSQKFKTVGGKSCDKSEECEKCSSSVEMDQKGIECEICKHWFHADCVDIEDNEYEVLTSHKKGSIHWYCDECNVKSVELFRLVFMIQEKMQKSEMEVQKMKTETNAKFQKIESEYDALKQDITTINQKIDEGLQRCFEDSEKLIRSTQQQTVSEIRTLNEEAKTTSFAEIMKQ